MWYFSTWTTCLTLQVTFLSLINEGLCLREGLVWFYSLRIVFSLAAWRVKYSPGASFSDPKVWVWVSRSELVLVFINITLSRSKKKFSKTFTAAPEKVREVISRFQGYQIHVKKVPTFASWKFPFKFWSFLFGVFPSEISFSPFFLRIFLGGKQVSKLSKTNVQKHYMKKNLTTVYFCTSFRTSGSNKTFIVSHSRPAFAGKNRSCNAPCKSVSCCNSLENTTKQKKGNLTAVAVPKHDVYDKNK